MFLASSATAAQLSQFIQLVKFSQFSQFNQFKVLGRSKRNIFNLVDKLFIKIGVQVMYRIDKERDDYNQEDNRDANDTRDQ